MGRRRFGSVRRLPSGRWQVRYYDLAGIRHTAPRTFPSKADANRYLAQVEADDLEHLNDLPTHVAELVRAAWELGGQRELEELRLRA